MQLNPAMDFVILAAIREEKGGFALNVAFNAARSLTALAIFSTSGSRWWRFKWLYIFVMLPLYLTFTQQFLHMV